MPKYVYPTSPSNLSYIKIHRRYFQQKKLRNSFRKEFKKQNRTIWQTDPLETNEEETAAKKTKPSLIDKLVNSHFFIFAKHIFKYSLRYGLKYFIFILTWLLSADPKNELYSIPVYVLYATSFLLVFVKETCTSIFRICFWLFNLALLSIFVLCFVQQLNSPLKHHSLALNEIAAVLLIYTFAYLYKHLNKVDASLAKLLFKPPPDPNAQRQQLLQQDQLNLKDVLRFQDYVLQTGKKPNALYRKSNWITFLVFLCPIFIVELAVYYTLMMNNISKDTLIPDSIYFFCLIILVFILNSIKAENINKVFLPCFFILFALFALEVYYLVFDCLNPDLTEQVYTVSYRKKLKLVLVVLSLKTCFSFVCIGFGRRRIRSSYKQTKKNFKRRSSVSSNRSFKINIHDSLEEPLIRETKEQPPKCIVIAGNRHIFKQIISYIKL